MTSSNTPSPVLAPTTRQNEAMRTQVHVPPGWRRPEERTLGARHLPLCSFGPGGSYIVDWQVKNTDLADPRRAYPPRTLGSIIGRVAGDLLGDLKLWLIATHPRRAFRADHAPAALEPCEACGLTSLWPLWFVAGLDAPPQVRSSRVSVPNTKNETPAETPPTAKPAAAISASEEDAPASYPFPGASLALQGSTDLEPVQNFPQSPAGRLIARLTAESRTSGNLRLFEDEPAPSSIAGEAPPPPSAQLTEIDHDPDSQATQDPSRHPGLPSPQRLFSDHAGTRRPARRLKGHNLRTRRGPGTQGTHPPCPEQGSLFGSLADGQAA